jgi:hypothetical protein
VIDASGDLKARCPCHAVEAIRPLAHRPQLSQVGDEIDRPWVHVRGQALDVAAVDALRLVVTLSGVL